MNGLEAEMFLNRQDAPLELDDTNDRRHMEIAERHRRAAFFVRVDAKENQKITGDGQVSWDVEHPIVPPLNVLRDYLLSTLQFCFIAHPGTLPVPT
jgi:hypothetical protein